MASPSTPLHKNGLIMDFLLRISPFAPFVQIEHRKKENKKNLKCPDFLCCSRYPTLTQLSLATTFRFTIRLYYTKKLAKFFQVSGK